jgi:polyisoprenoid-binding protein YceI
MLFSRTQRLALKFITGFLFSLFLWACASQMPGAGSSAQAGWQIQPERSSLSFVTTKAGAAGVGGVTELMRFSKFSGGMDKQGRINLAIELASIDSGVEIRDNRMRTMLWNVAAMPTAEFSAVIDPKAIEAAKTTAQTINVEGDLKLAGKTNKVQTQLLVSQAANGALMVSTRQPITINSNDFGLRAGVEALRDVMGLNFISTSAPVSLQLELKAI